MQIGAGCCASGVRASDVRGVRFSPHAHTRSRRTRVRVTETRMRIIYQHRTNSASRSRVCSKAGSSCAAPRCAEQHAAGAAQLCMLGLVLCGSTRCHCVCGCRGCIISVAQISELQDLTLHDTKSVAHTHLHHVQHLERDVARRACIRNACAGGTGAEAAESIRTGVRVRACARRVRRARPTYRRSEWDPQQVPARPQVVRVHKPHPPHKRYECEDARGGKEDVHVGQVYADRGGAEGHGIEQECDDDIRSGHRWLEREEHANFRGKG